MTQPHRLSCPGVTCDGTPRAHPPPRPGPGALPAPAPGAFSPSPFPEGESARHHHIPLPESSPQAPAAVACLGPSASCPRRVCTRPPSRGATSTEPQGLRATGGARPKGALGCGEVQEAEAAGEVQEAEALSKQVPAGQLVGAAGQRGDTAMQCSPVCSPGLTAIYENRGKLGRQPPVPRADSPSPA